MAILKQVDTENLENNEDINVIIPGIRSIRVNSLKDARRLLSRLIFDLQRGRIKGNEAKDLTYLLINFVNIYRFSDFEERIAELEEQKRNRKD